MHTNQIAVAMLLQLAKARSKDRLSPELDATPLFGSELDRRRRRIPHRDFELSLLTNRAIAHERGLLPRADVH